MNELFSFRPLPVDEPINDREAVPQLEYLAYEMCDRGVSQLREDEIIELLDRMRDEYPQVHAVKEHTSEGFLRLLERRTGILVEAGYVRHSGRPTPTFEFRHLTFQEYLAGLALVDGRFPNRDRAKNLAEYVAPLAAKVEENESPEQEEKEVVVTENWREAIRLCVSSCNDDDVDSVLLSILSPLETEDDSITSRPRTILAASCLADEPNAGENVVRKVLGTFVAAIRESDDIHNSTVWTGAEELSVSRWSEMLCDLLIEEFFKRDIDTRNTVGNIYGMVATKALLQNASLIPDWVNAQVELLSSAEDKNKARAALGLAYLAYSKKAYILPNMIEGLQPMLWQSAPMAHAAADALRWLNDERLEDRAWRPSRAVLEHLSSIVSDPEADPRAVQNLIQILGREAQTDALDVFLTRLQDERAFVRSAAAEALGNIKAVPSIPYLVNMLDDESSEVRGAAAEALGNIGDKTAIRPLISRLDDKDLEVQEEAVYALGEIGSPDAADVLILKLAQGGPQVRVAAARALGKIRDAKAVGPLIARLNASDVEENDFFIRIAAIGALGEIGGSRALEALVAALGSEDSLNRAFAAIGLNKALEEGQEELVTSLLKVKLNESDNKYRAAAIGSLNTVTHPAIVELVRSGLSDESITVKEAARNALASQAVGTFLSGDTERAAEYFKSAVSIENISDPANDLRNNFAYVLILLKQYEEAAAQLAAMNYSVLTTDWPLYQHNYGLVEFFRGEVDKAKKRLRGALDWIRETGLSFNPRNVICMLVIQDENVNSVRDLPVDATILLNLYKMGDLSEADLRTELMSRYPDEFEEWLGKFC